LRALAKQSQNNEIATSRILGTRDDKKKATSYKLQELKLSGVFVAIGHKPDTDLFKDQLKTDKKGYLLKNLNQEYPTMTSIEGVFVGGDCADPYYRQAATAAGSGVAAALDVERWLNSSS